MDHLPKTFKSAWIEKKGDPIKIIDREMPKSLAPHEVLIKVEACGICASDHMLVDGVFPFVKLPGCPGHEVIGKVAATGSEANEYLKVGTRVGAGWTGSCCYQCDPCRAGHFVLCEKGSINGITRDGGWAEYMVATDNALALVPEGLDSAEAAPLMCAGVTTFNSMRNVTTCRPGDLVAIQGIGGLGHLAVQFARAMGFRVAAISTSPSKKDLALKLGAHHYIDASAEKPEVALQKLGGAKMIVATAPHASAIEPLLSALAYDGTLLVLGASDPLKMDVVPMLMKRLTLRGWPSGTGFDSQQTLEFSALTGIKSTVERYKLEDVVTGYQRTMTNKAVFRSVIVFDS
ncbi:hypothetical protein SmJEL517_g01274 [Synchytrium microbalum]|uniref:Enoyl reductase (ER) domain-containing protein n=1 Tax=Synchytrium microbalum TaxID=1806994 RepID=A0A507CG56_9FUNG|nr:uncharacterized protein SmJEL517_g01274 [Synchytrium microbalum]TPX36575.1 hypothetical protein SmJEL517_g01274 [Synchytrium microbalum]